MAVLLEERRLRIEAKHRGEYATTSGAALSLQGKSYAAPLLNEIGTGPAVPNAIHTVLHPLSGLAPEAPVRAEEKAVLVPALEPSAGTEADETPAVLAVEPRSAGETAYIAKLFDYRSVTLTFHARSVPRVGRPGSARQNCGSDVSSRT